MIDLGPFALETPFASGGMGEVWRGYHRTQGIPVAVKLITAERVRTPRALRNFQREVQTMAGLDHPCIITVFDYGEVDAVAAAVSQNRLAEGTPYLAMELASGGTLLEIHGRLLWPHLKAVLLDVLDALSHAHARGVIHRDLKPENVLLFEQPDAFPMLKLTDFGLAHTLHTDEPLEAAGSTAGTPEYMAPEQLMGRWRDYGPWTDLYALGVMAYQLCSGRLPFYHHDIQEIMRAHIYEPPPALQPQMNVPSGFRSWLNKLLAKPPQERFQRAADAAWELFNMSDDAIPSAVTLTSSGSVSQSHPTPVAVTLCFTPAAEEPAGPTPPISTDNPTQLLPERETPPHLSDPMSTSGVLTAIIPDSLPPIPESWRCPEPERSMQLIGAGLGLYGLRPVSLVDRIDERTKIWETLHEVRDEGSARVLILRGVSGTGKSRLAEWTVERAHEVGASLVLKAMHSGSSRTSEGLPRMLAQHLRCLGLTRSEMFTRTRRILEQQGLTGDDYDAEVITEIMMPCGAWGDSEQEAHSSTPNSLRDVVLRRFIERLAQERPVLLWFDDVQWGSDALRFIEHTLTFQRLEPSPLFFLLTVNDEALEGHTAQQLELLQRHRSVTSITIDPLSTEDHRQLVHRLLRIHGDLADEVVSRTAGNPLFAIQLIGDWVNRGVLRVGHHGFELAPGERAPLPDDIHALWRARTDDFVQRFPTEQQEAARRALEVAAALGRDIDTSEWRTTCSLGGIHIPSRFVSALTTARLARQNDTGWSFAHGMLTESIARHATEAGRWQQHHRLCSHMLRHRYTSRQPGLAKRYAHHLLEARAYDEALEPLLTAANEALNTSNFERARRHLAERTQAMRDLSLQGEDPRWAENLLCQAGLQVTQGQLDEAVRTLDEASPLAEQMPLVGAEIARLRGMIAHKRGDTTSGVQAFSEALRLYHRFGVLLGIAHCFNGLGMLYQSIGDLDGASQSFESAIDIFEQHSDLDGVGMCLNGLAETCRRAGDIKRAAELLERAMVYLERSGDRMGVAACLNDLGDVARSGGDLDEAASYYQKALRRMEAMSPHEAIVPHNNLGLVHLARGEYQSARQIFERVLRELTTADRPGYQGVVHTELLPCAAAERRWDAWDEHFAHAEQLLSEHSLITDDIAWSTQLAGDLAVEAGDEARARKSYRRSFGTWNALGRRDKVEELRERLMLLDRKV